MRIHPGIAALEGNTNPLKHRYVKGKGGERGVGELRICSDKTLDERQGRFTEGAIGLDGKGKIHKT